MSYTMTVGSYAKKVLASDSVDHFNAPSEVLYIRDYGKDCLERYDVLIQLKSGLYTLNINDACMTYHDVPNDPQDRINFMKFTDQGTLINWKQLPAAVQKGIIKDIKFMGGNE